jgi:manganese/iron transport system permease protein
MSVIDIVAEPFMQRALLASCLAGVVCACVGVVVITMRLAFIGVCMSHAAFAGALIGLLVGAPPLALAFPASLAAAALIGPLADRSDFSPDTALGVIFASTLGVSFIALGLIPGSKAPALGLLWGSVLTVGRTDLWVLGGVTAAVIALALVFFKEIQAVVFDRRVAVAVGLPAAALFYGILAAAGAAITASLQIVGGLLVFSLIINPAAAAQQLTYRLDRMFLIAAALGVAASVIGLAISALPGRYGPPSGAAIVLTSSAIFGLAFAFSPKRRAARVAGGAP